MSKNCGWEQVIGCCDGANVSFNAYYQFSEKTSLRNVSRIRKSNGGMYKVSLRDLSKPLPVHFSRIESNLMKVPNPTRRQSAKKSMNNRYGTNSYHQKSSDKLSLEGNYKHELKFISSTTPHTAHSSQLTSCKLFKKKSNKSGSGDFETRTEKHLRQLNPEKTLNPESEFSVKNSTVQSARLPKRVMEELRTRTDLKKLYELSHRRLEAYEPEKLNDSEQERMLKSKINQGSVIIDESFVVADYFNDSHASRQKPSN